MSTDRRPFNAPSVATAANSTTLEQLEAGKRRAKLIISLMTSLAGALLFVPAALPAAAGWWSFAVTALAVLLFVAAIVTAYFTNALTIEEMEQLAARFASSTTRLGGAAGGPSDGGARAESKVIGKIGPPES